MVVKWNVKEDAHKYEVEGIFLLNVLYKANQFIMLNPQVCGLFDGQKNKKKKKHATSQDLQRL